MTPIRLNIPSSSSPLHEEENQEEYPSHVLLTLKPTSPLSTACSSSTPCEEKKDHGVRDQPQKGADKIEGEGGQEEEAEEENLLDQADPGFSTSTGSGTEDDHLIPVRSSPPGMFMGSHGDQINEGNNSTTKPVVIVHKQEAHHDHGDHGGSSTNQYCKVDGSHVMKWMSSKMRVMKKMANYNNPDQTPSDDTKPTACNELLQPFSPFQSRLQRSSPLCDDDNSTTNINSPKIRVCSDCNTTKTPLWRSGPQGPKSLCNACGIRQRKARRAMAAAAANGTQLLSVETSMRSSSSSATASNKAIQEKRSSSSGSTDGFSCRQYKKRCKLGAAGPPRSRKKIRFDEFTISTLSKSSAATFHQAVFPQDEEEAAILLMALSCGLVRG